MSFIHSVERVLENPVTAIIIALVLGAAALSGRFSVSASQLLLLLAWGVSVVSLRAQPMPLLAGYGAIIGGVLLLTAYYFRPEMVPAYSGILKPAEEARLLYSPKGGGTIPKLRIGTHPAMIVSGHDSMARVR